MDCGLGRWLVIRLLPAAIVALALFAQPALGSGFKDPRNTPAVAAPRGPSSASLLGVAKAGHRLVAVGLRGVIITSDNEGKTWEQQACPVSSDLVDVYFATPQDGWAVGFDGVIVRTRDGGIRWTKVLDGQDSSRDMVEYYKKLVAAGETDLKTEAGLAKANYYDGSGSLPWLGVWFRNKSVGYVVGSFGNIMRTADGGKHWKPWLEHVEDQNGLHLNDIEEINGKIYIAAEQGVVFAFNPATRIFEVHQTSYDGNFFGITGDKDKLIAYGLDGHAYISTDEGETWTRIQMPGIDGSITAGTTLPDGRVVLATSTGLMVISDGAAGRVFRELPVKHRMMYTGLVEVDPGIVLAIGIQGVHRVPVDRNVDPRVH